MATAYAPRAADADGDPITATLAVNGASLELDVPHSDPDIAYPIAVTTAITAPTVTPGFDGDPVSFLDSDHLDVDVQRTHTSWCDINPAQGTWVGSTGAADGGINDVRSRVYAAEAAGVKPLIVFRTDAPQWARSTQSMRDLPGCGPWVDRGRASIGSGNATYYGNAAQKLVYCLKGQANCPVTINSPGGVTNLVNNGVGIQGIELGNETNTHSYWDNGSGADEDHSQIQPGDATIYANAVRDAATKIHSIAVLDVSTGGLSYGSPDYVQWGNKVVDGTLYLQQMVAGDPLQVNAFALHPYGTGLHPDMDVVTNENTNVFWDTFYMRSNLDQLGYAGKQMWITEVGVDADYSANDSGAIDEERQRADLANTWSTVRHYCDDFNITLAVFWNLVDPDAYPPQGSARYYAGFMRAGYLSKAAYTVFANNDVLGPAYRSCY